MIYVNGIFAKGIPTYKIAGKRQSIIDVCLASKISSVKSFSVLPYILGVNPQTSHKIIQLTISSIDPPKKSRHKLKQVRKFNFCSYEALVKVKEIVSKRISELISLLPGRDIVYQYKNFSRIYWNTKKIILRLKTRNHKRAALSRPTRKLQFEVMFATAAYRRGKTEALEFKLSLLHKKLLEQCRMKVQDGQFLQALDH